MTAGGAPAGRALPRLPLGCQANLGRYAHPQNVLCDSRTICLPTGEPRECCMLLLRGSAAALEGGFHAPEASWYPPEGSDPRVPARRRRRGALFMRTEENRFRASGRGSRTWDLSHATYVSNFATSLPARAFLGGLFAWRSRPCFSQGPPPSPARQVLRVRAVLVGLNAMHEAYRYLACDMEASFLSAPCQPRRVLCSREGHIYQCSALPPQYPRPARRDARAALIFLNCGQG